METIRPSQPSAVDHQNMNQDIKQTFKMIDVGEKPTTFRRAVARGTAILSPQAFRALKDGSNPKGNVLALAEVAGVLMAKKTSELIPLCHPLPIEQVRLWFELSERKSSVTTFCEALTHSKTGVEMEALSGVQGALLTIYDLSKAVDPCITLSEIRLEFKEGGKTGVWHHPEASPTKNEAQLQSEKLKAFSLPVSTAILTISDRVSQGVSEDQSGRFLLDSCRSAGAKTTTHSTVADDKTLIQKQIRKWALEDQYDLILCTGGTGLGPRDVTPEALLEIADRKVDGIGELLRKEGSQKTSFAWLSRSVAITIGRSLIIAFPGSRKATEEGWNTIQPLLSHALEILKGGNHG